jgi:hypothetical protein
MDTSSNSQNSKSYFLFCVCLHTDSNAHLAEFLFPELPTILSPSVHSLHLLNAHLAEFYRILSDSVCNCVSPTQPYLLRCSTTSKVFSRVVDLQLLCRNMSLSDSAEFISASSVHSYQNPQRSVTPSWCEASKTTQA